jgi:hypothetical protein
MVIILTVLILSIQTHNSSLLTGDPEFKKLEKKEAISIEWLA